MARALITIPPNPKRGAPFEIRALIQHPMETGYRVTAEGQVVPRDIIRKFSCRFIDGTTNEPLFAAELFTAITANPLFVFHMVAERSGSLVFAWEGDKGFAHTQTVALRVA